LDRIRPALDASGDEPVALRLSGVSADLDTTLMVVDALDLIGVEVHATCLGTLIGAAVAIPAMAERVIHRAVPAPVFGHQRQIDQRPHRPVGAPHRIGQLEQRLSPRGQAPVEPDPEPGKLTAPGRVAILVSRRRLRHTGHRGHRLRLQAL
jgi:ATP-dependent Clp protease protease subunit